MNQAQSAWPARPDHHHPDLARAGRARLRAALATAALFGLAACGGGSGTGGLADGPSISPLAAAQVSEGVVTGFGSVIVDGVAIDDSSAAVKVETWDGQAVNAVLQLGQRVKIEHQGEHSAKRITIDAAIIGQVQDVAADRSSITVAGQPVNLNATAGALPITRYAGGYTDALDLAVSDWVEIHGLPVFDATSSSYRVQATRVQQLASEAIVRVRGMITDLDQSAQTFRFNGLTVRYDGAATAGTIRPAGAQPSEGAQALVHGVIPPTEPTTLIARAVRLVGAELGTLPSGSTAQLSGVISGFLASPMQFKLDGMTVDAAAAEIKPAGATLGNGDLVRVQGSLDAAGALVATSVMLRGEEGSSELARIRLVGEITDFVSSASFLVRSVPVDASGLDPSQICNGQPIADGSMVKVEASQQAGTPVVLAQELECVSPPPRRVPPLHGEVTSVDAAQQQFVIRGGPADAQVSYRWNDNTTFVGLTAVDLTPGIRMLVVDAALTAEGTRVARVVVRHDRVARLDGDAFRAEPPLAVEAPRPADPPPPRAGEIVLDDGRHLGRRDFDETRMDRLREARDRFLQRRDRPQD